LSSYRTVAVAGSHLATTTTVMLWMLFNNNNNKNDTDKDHFLWCIHPQREHQGLPRLAQDFKITTLDHKRHFHGQENEATTTARLIGVMTPIKTNHSHHHRRYYCPERAAVMLLPFLHSSCCSHKVNNRLHLPWHW
jgi:hypothetical protein